ncbi:MAG TPA: sulfatase-like hydrolase/transferase [Anaerolineales bacterium]|nr:sulfatase-like hydrolase/transferase [Anaerolineales bacterium]
MIKKVVLYPFLFVLYVILIPLTINLDQVDPALAVRPLVVLLSFTAAILLLLNLIFRDWHFAGYLVFLLLAFVFVFGHLWRLLQEHVQDPYTSRLVLLGIWGFLLVILGARRVWQRLGGAGRLTPLLNLLFSAAIVSQILFTLPALVREPARLVSASAQIAGFGSRVQLDCTRSPDIYYIILDAYGRSDVLAEFYGVDNRAFLESLERKGFFIADQSHTNYIQTIFSVASSLNMDYVGPNPPGVSGRDYFTRLIAANRLADSLKECGYRTIAFQSGFFFTDHPVVDLYLSRGSWLNEFESLVVADTPLSMLVDRLNLMNQGQGYQAHRERVTFTFEQLGNLASKPGPKFVFAHILSPHPPFVFDAQGQPIEPPRGYSIGDGDDFRGSWEEYRLGFAGQVQFVDRMLAQTIDKILAESESPPVIILQGDHGPGGKLDWDSPSTTCLAERTSILNAYYLPGDGSELLYPEISPVNSFRVILDEYFNAGLDLLPDKTYFTSHRLERQVIDVSAERNSPANCAPPATASP